MNKSIGLFAGTFLGLLLLVSAHPAQANLTEAQCVSQYAGHCYQNPASSSITSAGVDVGPCENTTNGNGNVNITFTCYSPKLTTEQCNSSSGGGVGAWASSCTGGTVKGSRGYLSGQVCCVPAAATGTACTSLSGGACVDKQIGCSTTQQDGNGTCSDSAKKCCVPKSGAGTTCESITGGVCVDKQIGCSTTQQDGNGTCSDSAKKCCIPQSNGGGGGGGGGGGSSASINFPNPLSFNTFQDFLTSVLSYLQGIVVLLALLFIVIGGVMYITSGGSDSQTKAAKATITAAMIGLAIGVAAPTFLKEIAKILGWSGEQSAISNAPSLSTILLNTLNFLLGVTGVLAIIMLVIGGFMYLTAAGTEKRVDTAKDIVKYSIFGIIVVLSALIIVKQIAAFFS